MRLRICISIIIFSVLCLVARAEESGDSIAATSSIVSHIEADSAIFIVLPDGLAERIAFVEDKTDSEAQQASKTGGYRIQVFSDNNARTAKSEARTRARNVAALFPQFPTYVVYNSPYWRLRVGNFRTREDAEKAAEELKEAFPGYVKEIRVVRDRIVLYGD